MWLTSCVQIYGLYFKIMDSISLIILCTRMCIVVKQFNCYIQLLPKGTDYSRFLIRQIVTQAENIN